MLSAPLAVCCLALAGPGPVPAPDAPAAAPVLRKLNAARRRAGVRPVRPSPTLGAAAEHHAGWIIRSDRFVHAGRLATPASHRGGEVMALFRRRATPRGAVRMWLNSPAHRAVVLDSGFRFAGVGKARGRFRGRRATVWVVRFAGG